MKKYLSWTALVILLATLVYSQSTQKMDQQLVQECYRALVPQAVNFEPINDKLAAAHDASGKLLTYVGVSSSLGYGGPMLVGLCVGADGTIGIPVIFSHKETPPYLDKIAAQGFFKQYDKLRADNALTPSFDVDTVSGATLSSRAIALVVNEVAHGIAEQALKLTPQKAELPLQVGVNEIVAAAVFALGILAAQVKALARFRLFFLLGSVGVLGFWLNRSFSVVYIQSAFMGFFPDATQNLLWYIVMAGVLLPVLLLGKNIYCAFICPFCGLQELTHKISNVDLSTGGIIKLLRPMRMVLLFVALFLGFLVLNPSIASYEPFGVIFGMNGSNHNWYLLFVMLCGSFFFHRFWCHVFCPAGAFLDFVASARRDIGKKIRCAKSCGADPKKCPAHAAEKTKAIIIASSAQTQSTDEASSCPQEGAKKVPLTKSQILFLLFYAAGLTSIIWTVGANLLPKSGY